MACQLTHAQFTFFYKEPTLQKSYQSTQNSIVKVNFPFTPQMQESSTEVSKILIAITKPFNITDTIYKTRSNAIYLQLDDYDFWLGKFHTLYDNFKSLKNTYNSFTPVIFDTEITLVVDSDYADQKYKNMHLFQTILVKTMNNYDNFTDMQNRSKQDTLLVITTLELLIVDFKHLFGTFSDLYQTLSLAKKGQFSDLLSDKISTQSIVTDWSNTEILEGGLYKDNIVFIIKVAQKSAPLEYFHLRPISYFGYALENDYYMTKTNLKIQKFYEDDKMTPTEISQLNNCLKGLNQKEYQLVSDHCIFTKTDKTYEILNRGILFHNGTQQIISQINRIFNNQITESDFPIVIHFNGSINLLDKTSKQVTITKKYPPLFQKTSLTPLILKNLQNSLFKQRENEIISLLQEEMIGVLLSCATVIILLLTIYLTKCLYKKVGSKRISQKPQEKLLIKKLRANRRN